MSRDRFQLVEADISETNDLLKKAYLRRIDELLEENKSKTPDNHLRTSNAVDEEPDGSNDEGSGRPNDEEPGRPDDKGPDGPGSDGSDDEGSGRPNGTDEKMLEYTKLFSERLNDIILRLDRFSFTCRVWVESLSFWTDSIRSELARQEAVNSTESARNSHWIAAVASLYLPLTAAATILGVPVLGWRNDWKDLKFKSVKANNQSNGSSGDSDSADTGLPVVSGYIWIYVGLSLFFFLITGVSYTVYTWPKVNRYLAIFKRPLLGFVKWLISLGIWGAVGGTPKRALTYFRKLTTIWLWLLTISHGGVNDDAPIELPNRRSRVPVSTTQQAGSGSDATPSGYGSSNVPASSPAEIV
ncbi:hypothetical protein O1611_g5575 [Lasiodiplodia mahajangana]|uniref:Uncharacterized protein n=1 Tax=Lasiodiplodia mahajangana TaxID=1108764 RepID=A0ACC2JKL9_9PEZI|nr:hypothetical protein O1611_g5575 [Lasiodiplodia mahajangana]